MKKSPDRILCLALSGIGNFLMQSPVFSALKERFPDSHLTVWVAPRGTKKLAEHTQAIDSVIQSPMQMSAWRHVRLVGRLAQQHYDVGIVLSPGQQWKSAAYLYLAGIPTRIGSRYPWRGNPDGSFLLTNPVREQVELHDIEQNLRLLSPLGIEATAKTYSLTIPKVSEEQAQAWLTGHHLRGTQLVVGFHAGSAANFSWKRWPKENFAAVGKEIITRYGGHILLFGSQLEQNITRDIKARLGSNATVVQTDLLTTAALLRRCRLMLSNDSGLMHLAAAAGVVTFGLFGPTDERHTGPRGADSHVIRAPGTVPLYHTEKNHVFPQETHPAMAAISTGLVTERLASYLVRK